MSPLPVSLSSQEDDTHETIAARKTRVRCKTTRSNEVNCVWHVTLFRFAILLPSLLAVGAVDGYDWGLGIGRRVYMLHGLHLTTARLRGPGMAERGVLGSSNEVQKVTLLRPRSGTARIDVAVFVALYVAGLGMWVQVGIREHLGPSPSGDTFTCLRV